VVEVGSNDGTEVEVGGIVVSVGNGSGVELALREGTSFSVGEGSVISVFGTGVFDGPVVGLSVAEVMRVTVEVPLSGADLLVADSTEHGKMEVLTR
jgi:hypothetical protein